RIDEFLRVGRGALALEVIEVRTESAEFQVPDQPAQPCNDQRSLGVGQRNSGHVIHAIANSFELALAQRKLGWIHHAPLLPDLSCRLAGSVRARDAASPREETCVSSRLIAPLPSSSAPAIMSVSLLRFSKCWLRPPRIFLSAVASCTPTV